MKTRIIILAALAAMLCSCETLLSDTFIDLDEQRLVFPAAGDIIPVQFTANASWTASTDQGAWCKVTPGSGESGLSTIRISAMPNTSIDERYAYVTISCGLSQKKIEVIQLEPNTVKAEQSTLSVSAEGGVYQVNVRHNIDYTVSVPEEDSEWIAVAAKPVPESKAMTVDVVNLEVRPNPYGMPREGKVLLESMLGNEVISVAQDGADVFALSVTSVELPGSGGAFEVNVYGTANYHISSMPDWVSEMGTIGRTHTFHAAENISDTSRDGAIIFCDDGGTCLPLLVSQEGMPEWAKYNFRHQSVFMRFTATWCGWCPLMNKSVKTAQQLYPNKIQHLAFHGSGSSLEFFPTSNLMNKYNANGFPTGVVDGRIKIDNGLDTDAVGKLIVNAVKETESFYGTVSGATMETSVNGSTLKVDARVFLKDPGSYLVNALIVEDGINAAQADNDGNHSSYIHDGVVRKFITSINGSSCSKTVSYSWQDFTWTTELDPTWKVSNLRVIVYVQAKYGSREKKRTENYGDYYIDNCFSVKVGDTLELETE